MENHNLNSYSEEQNQGRALSMPALMPKVFIWMTLALVITGFTAFAVATSPAALSLIYSSKFVFWGLLALEFVIVFVISLRFTRLSLTATTILFVLYSVINGATLSAGFITYSLGSIAKVFFICAGTFAAMSLIGLTTKRDLSKIGSILYMALTGLVIATVVNLFMHSNAFWMIISYVGVLIFVGLTAYDVQKIKTDLQTMDNQSEFAAKFALISAFSLYLDFINIFFDLLRILADRD